MFGAVTAAAILNLLVVIDLADRVSHQQGELCHIATVSHIVIVGCKG